MMCKKKNFIWFLMLGVAVAVLLVFSISNFAYAESSNEWRPSFEIEEDISALQQNISAINQNLNDVNLALDNHEQEKDDFIEEKNRVEDEYNQAKQRIEDNRSELEETEKNSYAAVFAMSLLKDLVGNPFIASDVFKWGFVTYFACAYDGEIVKLIEEYYDATKAYNDVLNREKERNDFSNTAQGNKNKYELGLFEMNKQLEDFNKQLEYMKIIESKYGTAGPSKITGDGYFSHPCPEGTKSSEFGESRTRSHDDDKEEIHYNHKGIDYSAPTGSAIYAAADGVVIDATYNDDYNGGQGMMIIIQHENGLVTKYMHCSHIYVPVGMHVRKGANIALIGSTGDSTGSHVHFQVELNGNPVDGEMYLKD